MIFRYSAINLCHKYFNYAAHQCVFSVFGGRPRRYVQMVEAAKKFFNEATLDVLIQHKLARLNITVDDLIIVKTMISELETARVVYLLEKGEWRDVMKTKDTAFAAIEDWMNEFCAVAKIGFKDHPQLLAELGRSVRC